MNVNGQNNLPSTSFPGTSKEELTKLMGNPRVYYAIIDRGFIDTVELFDNLLEMYSEIHHRTVEGQPCAIPTPPGYER